MDNITERSSSSSDIDYNVQEQFKPTDYTVNDSKWKYRRKNPFFNSEWAHIFFVDVPRLATS